MWEKDKGFVIKFIWKQLSVLLLVSITFWPIFVLLRIRRNLEIQDSALKMVLVSKSSIRCGPQKKHPWTNCIYPPSINVLLLYSPSYEVMEGRWNPSPPPPPSPIVPSPRLATEDKEKQPTQVNAQLYSKEIRYDWGGWDTDLSSF